MDSSDSSSSAPDSFKESKKILQSAVDKEQSSDQPAPDRVPWSSHTPEKPVNPPRRTSDRRNALRSLKQVKEAAKMLQKTDLKPAVIPDPFSSSAAPTQTPVAKSNTHKVLPEKYDLLNKFFNSLISSIRLLQMKGSKSTFTKIGRQIESLTDDRRFTYSHLAQLKFILPEAIELKKIVVHDERTSCMKPDLHVTLNFSAVENDEKLKSDQASLKLRKLFHSRLLSLFEANPEVDEVPEDKLPEPFNLTSQVSSGNVIKERNLVSVNETASNAITQKQSVVASHMPQSFRGRFSKQTLGQKAVTLEQEPASVAPETAVLPVSKPPPNLRSTKEGSCVSNDPSPSPVKWSSTLPETPIKSCDLKEKEDISTKGATPIDGTPSKLVLTPSSATPAQAVARRPRCFMTPDDDSMKSPSKLVRRSSGRRSIRFDTPVKNERASAERTSGDDEIYDILPESLLESIEAKERKALEEKDPAISQAKWRKQMIAGLPRLFDSVLFLFQSIRRSVITKEELVHRIISNRLDILDRREVEEQLRLLQELAPEWMHEKMTSSGDLLCCINQTSSPESIRTRLAEVKVRENVQGNY